MLHFIELFVTLNNPVSEVVTLTFLHRILKMIEALNKGKLSREQENMEDIITSIVFGMFKYLPPEIGLFKFLSFASGKNEEDKLNIDFSKCKNVEYKFWETLSEYNNSCEPDVLISFSDNEHKYLLLIEAKYNSGKSSKEDEKESVKDQLAREYMNLLYYSKRNNKVPIMIYLTKDVCRPNLEIEESKMEITKKHGEVNEIYWLSWRHITQIGKSDNLILNDLIELFSEHLKLFFYKGFQFSETRAICRWKFEQIFNWNITKSKTLWKFMIVL
jgi:hypothetical protein